MTNIKVYSDADGELFIDFSKVASVKKHTMISFPLEPGQYFVRLSTRNPLLYKETIVNIVDDCVFYAKKEDFLSKLTDTQLNSLQFVCRQSDKIQWIEELYSGLRISSEYDKIEAFQDGMCVVWKNKLCGFLNKRGEEIIPCKYEDFGLTSGGLTTVKLNNKWGAIDYRGEFKIPLQYDYCMTRNNDDYWNVSKDGKWEWDFGGQHYVGGKWGLCDKYGHEIIPCIFAHEVRVEEGFFIGSKSRLGSDVTVIKPNGDYLFSDLSFEEMRVIYGDLSLFLIKQDGKWGIIGLNGRFVCHPQFESVGDFTNDLCPVKMNDKWGIVNKSGSFIQQCLFDRIERDNWTGNYKVQINNRYGALDSKANMVLPCQFDSISIYNSCYIVKSSNFYGATDSRGTFVLPIEYESINRGQNTSYFVCKKNGLYGISDYRGQIRIPFSYSSISGPYDGVFIVGVNKNYGLLSISGEALAGLNYEAITYRSGLGFCFKLNGLWGVMNKSGRIVFSAKYYYIGDYCNGLFPVNIGGHEPVFWIDMGERLGDWFPGNVEDGQWGFINSQTEVIPAQFDACNPFGEHYTVIMKERRMGVISKNGEIIVPLRFSFCMPLSDSLFLTAEDSRISMGESEYDSMYEEDPIIRNMYGIPYKASRWNGRFDYFVKGGKYGLYSIGKEIIPPLYESIKPNKDKTLFIVRKDGKFGLIDKCGNTLIDCISDSLALI